MSRFVSGGTNDEPTERDAEWLQAQREVEANRRLQAESRTQEGGKSLYETLQANKAAKQEQFEEALKLRNQFRSLDEDEVAFLDNVLESTRAKEAEVKRETTEQLAHFRQQQEEAEKATKQGSPTEEFAPVETTWSVGSRKRKKGRQDPLAGLVKVRRTSSSDQTEREDEASKHTSVSSKQADLAFAEMKPQSKSEQNVGRQSVSPAKVAATGAVAATAMSPSLGEAPRTAVPSLGLGAYSSDESD